MSLLVYAYQRCLDNKAVERMKQPSEQSSSNMFGLETWRQKVWGSKTVRDLECRLLPSLKDSNIYAEGETLEILKTELNILLENIDLISNRLNIDKSSLSFRINNALECITLAQKHENGGVAIE